MALTKLTADVENHQKLDNNPSDDPGFVSRAARADALRVLFDKAAVDTKNYINGTLIPEIEAGYIASIARTSGTGEAGTTDTYTITYQDASTDTFTIYNGSDGAKGDPGLTGDTGPAGPAGRSINSITRTNGDGSAGTTDTYTITFSDSSTPIEFTIYNGADGEGAGDMLKSVYDEDGDGKVNAADFADAVPWGGVSDKPVSYPPDTHNHDAAYDATGAADTAEANAKSYVDGKVKTDVPVEAKFTDTVYTHPTGAGYNHLPAGGSVGQIPRNTAPGTAAWQDVSAPVLTATLTTTWTGASAPFTQDVTVTGLLATDVIFIGVVYSGTNATAVLQKTAWNLVGKIVPGAGKITATCFEEKPVTEIPIQIKRV